MPDIVNFTFGGCYRFLYFYKRRFLLGRKAMIKLDSIFKSTLAVLAWEAFQKVTLIAPWVASEAGKGSNGEDLDSSLGCHQVYPWCISTSPVW